MFPNLSRQSNTSTAPLGTKAPSPSMVGFRKPVNIAPASTNGAPQLHNVAAPQSLAPTSSGKDDKIVYNVDTYVAQNPYLASDLNTINQQAATISGQKASQANTPSPSLVAQSVAGTQAAVTKSDLSPQAQVANAQAAKQATAYHANNVAVDQQGFNAQQQNLANLQSQAQGRGPATDAIQLQSKDATDQGLNAQLALAGSMRGGNAGEALRQASIGQAAVTGQAANQAAMNTLQSEQQGITNAGIVAGAMQGESLQRAQQNQQNLQFNAGASNQSALQNQQINQQTALTNAGAKNTSNLQNQQIVNQQNLANAAAFNQSALQNQQAITQNSQFNAGSVNQSNLQTQNLQQQTALSNQSATNQFQVQQDQLIQSLMSQGMSLEQAQAQANISMAEYATGSLADQYAASQGHAISQQNADTSSANAAISGVATAANIAGQIGQAASDKRVKKDVKKGNRETSDFLEHLSSKSWNYKDPEKHGPGRYLGVMAQDLEKSKIGKKMVSENAEGTKMVNYGGAHGMAAIVASLAHLHDKIKKLESIRARK